MKKIIQSVLTLLCVGIFLCGNHIKVIAESSNQFMSEQWYQDLDAMFVEWSNIMGQSYTRYYPGDLDKFQHQGTSFEAIRDYMTINGIESTIALSNEKKDADYIIHAIYSTYQPNIQVDRLITYFLMESDSESMHFFVSEQLDNSVPFNFTPTANYDLSEIASSITNQSDSNYTLDEIALAFVGKNDELEYIPDGYKRFNYFLKQHYPEKDYQVFFGGPLMEADGSPAKLEISIEGKQYIISWGDSTDYDFSKVVDTLNQGKMNNNGERIVLLKKRDTEEYYAVYTDLDYEAKNYSWINDPDLIEGYFWAYFGEEASDQLETIDKKTIQTSNNRLLELFYQRDKSYSAEEFLTMLDEHTFTGMVPNIDMQYGQQYQFTSSDGVNHMVTLYEDSEGVYRYLQSSGGPGLSLSAFAVGHQIVDIMWYRGPTGSILLRNRESYEVEEEFEINLDQITEYWDAR